MIEFAGLALNPRHIASVDKATSTDPKKPYKLRVWFSSGGSTSNLYASEAERDTDFVCIVEAVDQFNGVSPVELEEEPKEVRGFECT